MIALLGRMLWRGLKAMARSRVVWALWVGLIGFALFLRWAFPDPSPALVRDACALMAERPGWWRAVRATHKRWGVPPATQLAVMRKESSFQRFAHPPRMPPPLAKRIRAAYRWTDRRFGWSLADSWSWPRIATAYGYPQAINATWARYKTDTDQRYVTRIRFRDATDFIGWHWADVERRFDIPAQDVCSHYIVYHIGRADRRCEDEAQPAPRALELARMTARFAEEYAAQLGACHADLDAAQPWWLRPKD